jgi:hypothetical protein
VVAKEFMAAALKTKWNPRMNEEAFKKIIYFPIVLKKKKEMPERADQHSSSCQRAIRAVQNAERFAREPRRPPHPSRPENEDLANPSRNDP